MLGFHRRRGPPVAPLPCAACVSSSSHDPASLTPPPANAAAGSITSAAPAAAESGTAGDQAPAPAAAGLAWPVGARVRLKAMPRYLRSADPMPMLRPPDLIDADEGGLVVELRPLGQRAVRFRRGTFLLDVDQLRAAP